MTEEEAEMLGHEASMHIESRWSKEGEFAEALANGTVDAQRLQAAHSEAAAMREEIARLRGHINHMANWITRANRGVKQGPYSFEALGEDFAALERKP